MTTVFEKPGSRANSDAHREEAGVGESVPWGRGCFCGSDGLSPGVPFCPVTQTPAPFIPCLSSASYLSVKMHKL